MVQSYDTKLKSQIATLLLGVDGEAISLQPVALIGSNRYPLCCAFRNAWPAQIVRGKPENAEGEICKTNEVRHPVLDVWVHSMHPVLEGVP